MMLLAFGPGNGMSKWGSFMSCNFVSGVAIISSSFKDGWRGCGRNAIAENGVPGALRAYTRCVALGTALRGRLNLRRRGLAGGRPGRKFVGARGCWRFSFAFPADASVLAIFKNYTMFGQFLADAIGGSEVAALAGGVTLGN